MEDSVGKKGAPIAIVELTYKCIDTSPKSRPDFDALFQRIRKCQKEIFAARASVPKVTTKHKRLAASSLKSHSIVESVVNYSSHLSKNGDKKTFGLNLSKRKYFIVGGIVVTLLVAG